MPFRNLRVTNDDAHLSPTIYVALVDSLFQNFAPVFIAAVSGAVAVVLTATKTGQLWLWPCALLLILLGAWRAAQMRQYERRTAVLTPAEAVVWECRYKWGAVLYAAALGLWCVVALLGTDDFVAHLLCTTMTIGYVAARAGRNYGRPRIAQLQIVFACGPMAAALILRADPYYFGLALLQVLFFIGLKHINIALEQTYVKAMFAHEREAALANQFDAALNNMPYGLCMFTPDGRLAVINSRFGQMMKLRESQVRSGTTIHEIISACVAVGSVQDVNAESLIQEIERRQDAEVTILDTCDGNERALQWTFQPMAGGGTVVLVEDVTEQRNAEARIIHLARFDALTGLPNRQTFRDEIDRELTSESGQVSALLFIDLDQFKQVNDTLGHPCGDRLLCEVADRLRGLLGENDFVARFGGDEFVVFQRNIASREDSAELARRIVERLSERYQINRHLVEIGASIGIAVTEPGVDADHLLKNADMALYQSKTDGRGQFCFFQHEMAEAIERRRTLEIDLRQALVNEEFELFFQPLVNLKSGRISTCEALLRWRHPVRGLVSPADVIPVAEEMGLIVDLGRWILREACIECAKWPKQVRVAVNLSPLQFHQAAVLDDIRFALQVSGLEPNRLEVEITESSLMRNTEWTRRALGELQEEGIRIALDDFGTGYSSLSYLHSFPLDKVKIDRSFLEGIREDKPLMLLRGVARLSADLGMSVVVEGIETNEQLEIVAADGTVTEAQGYLFSRPVAAGQIRQLLAASHGQHAEPAASDHAARTAEQV